VAVQELTVQAVTGGRQLAGRQVQICQQTTAIFLLPNCNLSIANIDLKYITIYKAMQVFPKTSTAPETVCDCKA